MNRFLAISNSESHTPRSGALPQALLTVSLITVALSTLSLSGCSESPGASPEVKKIWRFAIEEAEGSVQHQYAMRFKKLIEERTDGDVKVVVYPVGTLGSSSQITEQLNMGIVNFAMASPGSLGKYIPELQVFLLHFVLPRDDDELRELLNDKETLAMFDSLYEPKGLKLLSIYSEGDMVWTTKKEIRKPRDFRGVKIRVMTSPLLLASYSAYGASPTPMPYSEVYSGLQLNMIDAQVNPIFAIERQKFYEVTSWLTFPQHTSFITTCASNQEFFNGLSEERQELVTNVIDELEGFIFNVQTTIEEEKLKKILQDKKEKRDDYSVAGDLDEFIDSLSEEERKNLITDNEYLKLKPALTVEEIERFREASKRAREIYLRIGGKGSKEILERLSVEQK